MKHANVAVFIPHAGCPHQCSFCDQRSISGSLGPPSPEYVAGIVKNACERLEGKQAQIAFFGGSFTALDREYMSSLLKSVQPWIGPGGLEGIRISTRPDCIDKSILRLLARFHVKAIELGVQSMDNRVLAVNGRGHTAQATERSACQIREAGFELGFQMMTGLPGDSEQGAVRTANELIRLKPDTVRIYPVLVLEHTPLAAMWRRGEYQPQSLEEAADLCARLLQLFEAAGVSIIRVGLHDEQSLKKSLLAGPWHPAFRELCESRLMLSRAAGQLEGVPKGEVLLKVHPRWISRMAGQRRGNIRELRKMGYACRIKGCTDMLPGAVQAQSAENHTEYQLKV